MNIILNAEDAIIKELQGSGKELFGEQKSKVLFRV